MRTFWKFRALVCGTIALYSALHALPSSALKLLPLGPNKEVRKLNTLAYDAFKAGDNRTAVRIYTKMIQLDPECGRAYYMRAAAYSNLKQTPLAIYDFETYAKILKKCPTATPSEKVTAFFIPHMLMISSSYRQDKDGTAEYMRDAKATYGPGFFADGKVNMNFSTPLARFQTVSAEDIPKQKKLTTTMDLMTLYKIEGEPEKALPLALKVAETLPKYAEHQQTVGDCYLDMGKLPEAIAAFTRAIALNPSDPFNYYCRAVAYAQAGQEQKALDDYHTGWRYDGKRNRIVDEMVRMTYGAYLVPGKGEVQSRCGNLQLKLKNYPKAIEEFSTAITMSPKLDEAYFGRAGAYIATHNLDAAAKDYEAIIKFNPDDERVYKERGELRMLQKDYTGAVADFSKVIQLDPKESWRAYESRAKAYDKLGKKDLASADRLMVQKSGFKSR